MSRFVMICIVLTATPLMADEVSPEQATLLTLHALGLTIVHEVTEANCTKACECVNDVLAYAFETNPDIPTEKVWDAQAKAYETLSCNVGF